MQKIAYPITLSETKEWAGEYIFKSGQIHFKEGKVFDVAVTPTQITAKVRNGALEPHLVKITAKNDVIESVCDCEYEWHDICEHATAVLIQYLDQIGETSETSPFLGYLGRVDFKEPFTPQFDYALRIQDALHPVFLQIYDKQDKKWINQLEGWLPRNPAQQNERSRYLGHTDRSIFSLLMQKGYPHKTGFNIDPDSFALLLPLLKSARILMNLDTNMRYQFATKPALQSISIQNTKSDNAQLKLELILGEKKVPPQQVIFFGQPRGYLLWEQTFYEAPLTALIPFFQNQSSVVLSPEEKISFALRYAPEISKFDGVELPEEIKQIKLSKLIPTPVLKLQNKNKKLLGDLIFNYENVGEVSANVSGLYFLSKKPNLYIERDKDFEQAAVARLQKFGFTLTSTGQQKNWVLETHQVVDFLVNHLPLLAKEWKILGTKDLIKVKMNKQKMTSQYRLESGQDWFEMVLDYKVGAEKITHEQLKTALQKGQKYFQLKDGSQILIPEDEVAKNQKLLDELGVEKTTEPTKLGMFHLAHTAALLGDDQLEIDNDLKKTLEKIRNFEEIEEAPLSVEAKKWLRPYQIKGLHWLWFLKEFRFSGILADDMGLGKTFQTLFFLQMLKSNKPHLIVCPTSVLWNWKSEVEKLGLPFKIVLWSGNKRAEQTAELKKANLVITTYHLVRRDLETLGKVNYDYIILDEAQNIKNAASQTAKAVKTLNSSQRLALTGTPIENHLSELWSIFDFLMPGFLGAQSYFQDYYQVPIEKLSQVETAKHLQNKIKPFVLRRLKKQVLTELPEKTEIATYCEMTDEQKEIYRDIVLQTKKDLMQKIKKEGIEKNQLNILSALLRLRQICCHPGLISPEFEHLSSGKFELFKETISEILEEKHRILVFSQFVSMLTIIKNWAKQNDIPFAYLDGSTKNRQEIIEKFQKEKNASLFLLSLKAGGTGLNLTNADYVVHFDPWWNPAVEDQATDRAHRMGQEKKVFVYKMITKNSVEEKILRLQQDKRKLNESVIVADQSFAKQITKEDLESLFDFEDI